jgi:hypothetical protein
MQQESITLLSSDDLASFCRVRIRAALSDEPTSWMQSQQITRGSQSLHGTCWSAVPSCISLHLAQQQDFSCDKQWSNCFGILSVKMQLILASSSSAASTSHFFHPAAEQQWMFNHSFLVWRYQA